MQTPQHDELRRTLCCAARMYPIFSDVYLIGVPDMGRVDETASSTCQVDRLDNSAVCEKLMSKKICTDLSSPQIIRKLGFNSTFSNGDTFTDPALQKDGREWSRPDLSPHRAPKLIGSALNGAWLGRCCRLPKNLQEAASPMRPFWERRILGHGRRVSHQPCRPTIHSPRSSPFPAHSAAPLFLDRPAKSTRTVLNLQTCSS